MHIIGDRISSLDLNFAMQVAISLIYMPSSPLGVHKSL